METDRREGAEQERMRPTGSNERTEALFASLYDGLRRLARREVRRNGADAVLGTGTLVHEAWLDMSKRPALDFDQPGRFLAYAARTMRGLVVDRVRAPRREARRQGRHHRARYAERRPGRAADDGRRHRRGARGTGSHRSRTRQRRRPQVLLRLHADRDRADARRLGADRPATVGKGADAAAAGDGVSAWPIVPRPSVAARPRFTRGPAHAFRTRPASVAGSDRGAGERVAAGSASSNRRRSSHGHRERNEAHVFSTGPLDPRRRGPGPAPRRDLLAASARLRP